jgi:GAF domain-containing protein
MCGGSDAFIFEVLMPRWYADRFAEVARTLANEPTLAATLQSIVRQATTMIPGAEYAAITTGRTGSRYQTIAFSDTVPVKVDEIQYDKNEGPCLTALAAVELTHTGDLATDCRWPQFGPAASKATGVLSMLSSPLHLEDETILGALNLYARKPDAFDEADQSGCAILSTHSAIALSRVANREQKDHLAAALESNRKIGAAIGILMAKHLISEQQAFDALRIASQHTHRKLVDIAYDVVETGELIMPARTSRAVPTVAARRTSAAPA